MKKKIKKILLMPLNMLFSLNPTLITKLIYFIKYREKLNLKNPKSYNEKLNWLKLNYRNKLVSICADKYLVRKHLENNGLKKLLINLLWEGENPNDIPFDRLPKKFVIKLSNGSGNNIICKDKTKLNKEDTIKKLKKWLKEKYMPCYGEWFYNIYSPKILIEEFISENDEDIPEDYKFFCFNNINGKRDIGVIVIDTDRYISHKRKTYDKYWNERTNVEINFPYDNEKKFEKPKKIDDMLKYALKLSEPFPHARVDFYVIKDKIYFGEITFLSDAGFGKVKPKEFSLKMGDWIEIPNNEVKNFE